MVLWISARVACVLIAVSSLCQCDAHYARLTSKIDHQAFGKTSNPIVV